MTWGASGISRSARRTFEPLHARHLHVEEEDVGHGLLEPLERGLAVGHALDLVTLAGELSHEQLAQVALVVGHQDAKTGALMAPPPSRTGSTTRNVPPLADLGLELDVPAVLVDDALGDGEPETGALARRLGGEEGIEHPRDDVGSDASPSSMNSTVTSSGRRRRVRTVSGPWPWVASSAFGRDSEEDLTEQPLVGHDQGAARARGRRASDSESEAGLAGGAGRAPCPRRVRDRWGSRMPPGSRTTERRLPVISLQRKASSSMMARGRWGKSWNASASFQGGVAAAPPARLTRSPRWSTSGLFSS